MTLPDFTNDELLTTSSQIRGLIVISGVFNGDICNGTDVYVTPSGCINGCIKTKNLIVAGKVNGDVEADNLKICASGRLYFNEIHYNDLDVEEGGLLINHVTATIGQKRYPLHVKTNVPNSGKSDKEKILSSNEHVQFKSSF